MSNAIIIVPTAGRTYEDIVADREKGVKKIGEKGQYSIRDNLMETRYSEEMLKSLGIISKKMFFLSKVLESMAGCEVAYFASGWENDDLTKDEHQIAAEMGIDILAEE